MGRQKCECFCNSLRVRTRKSFVRSCALERKQQQQTFDLVGSFSFTRHNSSSSSSKKHHRIYHQLQLSIAFFFCLPSTQLLDKSTKRHCQQGCKSYQATLAAVAASKQLIELFVVQLAICVLASRPVSVHCVSFLLFWFTFVALLVQCVQLMFFSGVGAPMRRALFGFDGFHPSAIVVGGRERERGREKNS